MTKPLSEMDMDELADEANAWHCLLQQPKGPGQPTNDGRRGAERLYEETMAWLDRRSMETNQ